MKFDFDWNYISAGAPYMTISESGLSLNMPAINMLGCPEEVLVGFDKGKMAIGIKPAQGSENAKKYKFKSRIKNGWVRIGCRDFVKYLSVLTGIKFSPAKRFIAVFDESAGVLYVIVDKSSTEEGE